MPSPPEQRVLAAIIDIRAQHHACTATAVAARLRLNKTYVLSLCDKLRKQDLVDWTKMPGSLHLVSPSHVAVVVAEQSAAEPAGDTGQHDDAETDRRQRQKEALARGRAKAAANRAARKAAGEIAHA